MKQIVNKILVGIMVCLFIVNVASYSVYAEEDISTESPCILLEKYEISNEGIIPGSPFILTLYLYNYSAVNADNIVLNVSNPTGVMPKYGTVTQVFLGNFMPGETKKIEFEYEAYTTITADYLNFSVLLYDSYYSNSFIMSVPVSTDVPLSVTGVGGPVAVSVNENVSYYVQFKTLGKENVSNVCVVLRVNGNEVSQSNIGIMKPDTIKSQTMTLFYSEPGNYNVEILLTYMDRGGSIQTITAKSMDVYVEAKEEIQLPIPTPTKIIAEQDSIAVLMGDSYFVIGLAGITMLFIIVIMVILVKKKR